MIVLFVPASGQQLARKPAAELRQLLQQSKPDSNRVLILHALSRSYLNRIFGDKTVYLMDTAIGFIDHAIRLSDTLQLTSLRYEGMLMKAEAYVVRGDIAEGKRLFIALASIYQGDGNINGEARTWLWMALKMHQQHADIDHIEVFFKKAISLYIQADNSEGEAKARTNLADYQFQRKEYALAEQELLQSLDLLHKVRNTRVSNVYYLLSVVNRYRGAYEKALLYATRCIENAEYNNDTAVVDLYYGEIALVYDELGRAAESGQWYRRSMEERIERNTDPAIVFRTAGFLIRQLIKSGKSREALLLMDSLVKAGPPQTPFEKAVVAQNYAYCYDALKQYVVAERYFLDMAVFFKDFLYDPEQISLSNRDIGRFYLNWRKFDKARGYLDTALLNRADDRLIDQCELFHMRFVADSALGDYAAAVKDLRAYQAINDSLYNERKSRQIEELTIQYETEKKEQSIRLLEKEKRLQQQALVKEYQTKRWIVGLTLLLIILVGMLINYLRLKQRTNKALQVQQGQIEKKNISLQHLVEEKEWLVKEIHHRVKNNFHMVMGLLHTQAGYLQGEEAIQAITESQLRIQAMSLVHQRLYQSENMSAINMSDYIHELIDCLKDSFHTGHRIWFNLDIEPVSLNVSHCIPLGLILNEAITNAIKHAFPGKQEGRIEISLQRVGQDRLLLAVKDNGVGMAAGVAPNMGMKLMRGLGEDLDGVFQVNGKEGTTLLLEFTI
jgi:two-component sensor histidine kinase